jgi:hypothetical protein
VKKAGDAEKKLGQFGKVFTQEQKMNMWGIAFSWKKV